MIRRRFFTLAAALGPLTCLATVVGGGKGFVTFARESAQRAAMISRETPAGCAPNAGCRWKA